MKKCGICKILKEESEYAPCHLKRSGSPCRDCNTKKCKEYRDKNLEKTQEYSQNYSKGYYQENKTEISEKKKEYIKNNKEEVASRQHEYYLDHKEEKREYNKKYHEEHKEEIKEKRYIIEQQCNIESIITKKCSQCQIIKENIEFSISQLKKSGGICRSCNTQNMKEYRERNPEEIQEYYQNYNKEYYQENKTEILQDKKAYREGHKEERKEKDREYHAAHREERNAKSREYYRNNREAELEKRKIYAQNNQESIREYHNEYYKNKRKEDINFRLKTAISANINYHLKTNGSLKNNQETLKYLPYSIDILIDHLEKQFIKKNKWMNWDNYGKYDAKTWDDNNIDTWTWQIDHKKPHSTFKYKSMEDESFKKCWALKNLRPLSSKQNFLDGVRRTRHK